MIELYSSKYVNESENPNGYTLLEYVYAHGELQLASGEDYVFYMNDAYNKDQLITGVAFHVNFHVDKNTCVKSIGLFWQGKNTIRGMVVDVKDATNAVFAYESLIKKAEVI